MNRIAALEKFLEEDPHDPFNYYALALELLKTDRQKAGALFDSLLKKFPDYLPTYYPYAHWMIEENETARAEELFAEGIRRAQAANDAKTARELQAAYTDFKYGA